MDTSAQPDDRPLRFELPDSAELHFIERGTGPAIVLLHGGMGDCMSWGPQLETLSARFRVIAYSRRHSSPNRNPAAGATHSLQVDLDDLAALVRSLHIAPAHLVATSYGALVALAFALDHPRKVLSLTLAEPPLHEWACRTATGARLYAAFVKDVWIPARAAFEEGAVHDALRVLTDGIWGREIFASLPPHRVASAARNAESMRALTRTSRPFSALTRADVSRLSVPTLLVNGEHSSALHLNVVDELALVLPAATRAVIPGAGHAAPLENSDGFNRAMQEFLEGCRTRNPC